MCPSEYTMCLNFIQFKHTVTNYVYTMDLMLLDFENKFAVATNRTATQGLLFQFNSIMFFDRLEYSNYKGPTYSVPCGIPDPSNLALPSVKDYLHINLLYCQGQRMQGYIWLMMYVCMYLCTYVYMYDCMYVNTCIIYTHIPTSSSCYVRLDLNVVNSIVGCTTTYIVTMNEVCNMKHSKMSWLHCQLKKDRNIE